jgi:hypothetical protein
MLNAYYAITSLIFSGKEHAILYRDCCYFGLETEKVYTSATRRDLYVEETKFVISNEWQDKALGTGINFYRSKYSDFAYIVEYINDFIQRTKVEAQVVPDAVRAYPMLKLVRSLDEGDSDVSDDEGPHRGFSRSDGSIPLATVTPREDYCDPEPSDHSI